LVVNGFLDLNTFSDAVNDFSGASTGVVDTIAGGNVTLTTESNDVARTYAGVLQNSSGSLALVKNGAATLNLTNPNSTYSGGTTLNGGKIRVTGSSTPESGVLTSGPIGTGTLTLSGGSFDNQAASTLGNAIVVTASTSTNVTTSGATTFALTGPVTGAGTIVVSGTGSLTSIRGDISGFTGTFSYQGINAASSDLFFDGTTAESQDGSQARFEINGLASNDVRFGAFDGSIFKMGELSGMNVRIRNEFPAPTSLQIGALNTSSEYSGIITNGGASASGSAEPVHLDKVGTGTLTLSGATSYNGTTTVTAGTLLVNGTHDWGDSYAVKSGGTLGGTGNINTRDGLGVTVEAGGKLAPGASAGTLHMNLGTGVLDISGAVAASNSQSMVFELDAIGASDQIQLTNALSGLNIGFGSIEFDDFAFTNLGGMVNGVYTLFDSGTPITGTLGSSLSGTIGRFVATLSIGDGGNDILLTTTGGSAPGDFNNDGHVNAADYVLWRKNPGAFGGAGGYATWRANFGNPPGAGAGLDGGAVPEPAALAMAVAIAICSCGVRAGWCRRLGAYSRA
jgi:autotransporter-associated beta strand protein